MIRHLARLVLLSLTCTLLFACAQSPEDAAAEEARDDLRCENVTVVAVQVEESLKGCRPMIVSAFGCGRTADYRCRAGVRDCDYRCWRNR